jgi:small subunit ribosomal protein S20
MAEAVKKKRAVPKGRHQSQIKRERQTLKRHARNVQIKSLIKTAVKKVTQALGQKNKEQAKELLKSASRAIQKAVSKGVVHKRNAARKISRLAARIQSIG